MLASILLINFLFHYCAKLMQRFFPRETEIICLEEVGFGCELTRSESVRFDCMYCSSKESRVRAGICLLLYCSPWPLHSVAHGVAVRSVAPLHSASFSLLPGPQLHFHFTILCSTRRYCLVKMAIGKNRANARNEMWNPVFYTKTSEF